MLAPFSLEEYLKNPDRPVVTRDGRPARVVSTRLYSGDPVLYLVEREEKEEVHSVDPAGRYVDSDSDHPLDLLFQDPDPVVPKAYLETSPKDIPGGALVWRAIGPNLLDISTRMTVEPGDVYIHIRELEDFYKVRSLLPFFSTFRVESQ